MAQSSASIQSQWDSRNRGFIPPTQLRQQSPSNEYTNYATQSQPQNNGSIAPPIANQSQAQAPLSPQAQQARPLNSPASSIPTHSRTSSFFSAFRKNQSVENKLMNNSEGGGAATYPGAQPGSAGGPVNEFGGVRSSQYDAQTSVARPRPGLTKPPPPDSNNPQAAPQQLATLHPEIRSVVQLTSAHSRKVYFSGPLVRRLERQPDGSRPVKDEGWTEVWAQLGGTTLSIWDMKAIAEASKDGKEVPPTYINVQDAVGLLTYILQGCVCIDNSCCYSSCRFWDL